MYEKMGQGQREGEKNPDRLPTVRAELAMGLKLNEPYHDLSRSCMLNRLCHPGTHGIVSLFNFSHVSGCIMVSCCRFYVHFM